MIHWSWAIPGVVVVFAIGAAIGAVIGIAIAALADLERHP